MLTPFIILDNQPLSVVDNVGFRHLLNVLELKIPSHSLLCQGSRKCWTSTVHAKQFWGSFMGQAIASIFLEKMLETWAIPKSSVHAVVNDNGKKNMIKGM